MMKGKIIKGISGFYYVHVVESGIYECKAKGIFRNRNMKPMVGDDVEIEVLSQEEMLGNIEDILPRMNSLIRPAVANVDQALIIFAFKDPEPNYQLLDRFLVQMRRQEIPVLICFNKSDLGSLEQQAAIERIYEKSMTQLFFVSAKSEEGLDLLFSALSGKTTTVAGPSGVGKSSLINRLQKDIHMETGVLSEKIKRGKHTTRHSQLISLDHQSYILDTPGFSTLELDGMEATNLKEFYPDFEQFEPYCKFGGCNHIGERDCGVKDAVESGELNKGRYDNYCYLFEELKQNRKY